MCYIRSVHASNEADSDIGASRIGSGLVQDIQLCDALLLWNLHPRKDLPPFAVRSLGHSDYERYEYQNGACMREWQEFATLPAPALLAKAIVELWHIVAFCKVPVDLVHAEMLKVLEYRNMLADECLPPEFQHERD